MVIGATINACIANILNSSFSVFEISSKSFLTFEISYVVAVTLNPLARLFSIGTSDDIISSTDVPSSTFKYTC